MVPFAKVYKSPLVLASLLASIVSANASENIDALIAEGLSANPMIQASEARWDAFKNRVAQAGAWEDPMLMLGVQNGMLTDPLNFRGDSATAKVIGLSQEIPFYGKRKLRTEIAQHEADAAKWQLEERKLELTRMIRESALQIFFIDQTLGITARNTAIVEDLSRVAQTKYSIGQAPQQDLINAELEKAKMVEMRLSLEQQRKKATSALNALLYRPLSTPVTQIPEPVIGNTRLDADELLSGADQNRPLLKSYRALIDKASAGKRLAQKESLPDFRFSVEYMQRDDLPMAKGDDMYSASISFNLPALREKRRARIAESNSELLMAKEELNAVRNEISDGLNQTLADMEKATKVLQLYRSAILPQAQRGLETAVTEYQSGKIDFATLLETRASLFQYEREAYAMLTDYGMSHAKLQALTGIDSSH